MAEGDSSPDYWQMICDHRDKILAFIKETDWTEVKNKDGIRITYKDTGQGRMFHIETELNVPPATARRYFTPGPQGLRDKFARKNIKDFKVVHEADKYIIAHEIFAGNMIVSDRDMVCVYGGEDQCDIGAYMVHSSVEHPDCPPQPKPVRATKHIAGQMLLRVDGDPNKCVFHGVALVDMGGMMPASMVQSFQPKKMFENATQLKQAIANKFHEAN
ncbi:stAR-related lipid transfer protein 5-like [Dysidea avara]|uniref:stAR-related lipid transfer protein 5-like n=1 Tax=Dysidea avara TaxID=196820 RepID=UPI00331A4953